MAGADVTVSIVLVAGTMSVAEGQLTPQIAEHHFA
jgi:hypothetical protein